MHIRLGEVVRVTGLSKSEIYRRIKDGRFPRQRRISHRIAVWRRDEVEVWMEQWV